ncbi:MAG: phosphoribosylglycinamide formyltransferase [Anaerolineaceae bacterium]|nr:phosphoribosylglycinamide formyltransferase [Anaerolineaceae bacterium]
MINQDPIRLAVLISGNGSNLQAILDATSSGLLQARVVVVVSNRGNAYGIERAKQAGINALVLEKQPGQDKQAYDEELVKAVASFAPHWVILAGWMRLLSAKFLSAFPNRVINIHPALPGSFPGTHAIERAFTAYQKGEIQQTGVMVHLVPDEGVDCGPVLNHETILIQPDDSLETLEQRVHQVEHTLIVNTLNNLVSQPK